MGIFDAFGTTTEAGKKFEKLLAEMSDKQVAVGFNADSGSYDDGASLVEVAAWNELGTRHIPSRPFIHDAIEFNNDKITMFAGASVRNAIENGGSAEEVLNQIGNMAKGLVQEEIRNGMWTPNAPSTIRKKGSDHPLIDTGYMRQNVKYVIEGRED